MPMRKEVNRRVPWFFLAALVGLLAAWPFLQYPGLPQGTDAELHVFRTAELGYSLQSGQLYPRWAPNFFHGFGYPIFNYYAPLTYHLGYWLALGRPEDAEMGARLVFLVAFVGGAIGAYLLGREFGDEGGGLLGAIAFSFAPYIQLINAHIRGDLPESFALAAIPWVLWGWERVWRRGGGQDAALAAVTTAVAFVSHNLTALTCVVLVGLLSLWRWRGADHRRLLRAVAVGVIFVLLTSFFWLPFLMERPAIKLDVAGDGHYDFRNHFVPLRQLLAPLPAIVHRSSTAAVPMSVGPQFLALSVLGAGYQAFIWIKGRRGEVKMPPERGVAFYIVTAGILLWLTTESSKLVWELVPGMAYYQFPWRFIGPAAALLVPPIACLARPIERAPSPLRRSCTAVRQGLVPGLAACVMMLGALPGFYPMPWESGFERLTHKAIVAAELQGRWRGTTSTNDFVPATVDMIPGPQESLLASYTNPPIDRVNRATLPSSAAVTVLPEKPWVNLFDVRADEGFRLRLYLFDFPGWRAYIDGVEVPIEMARPEGFITVWVPAGHHEVRVAFTSTPVRTASWLISLAGLGVLVATMIEPRWWFGRIGLAKGGGGRSTINYRGSWTGLSIGLAILVIVLLKVVWFDHVDWFHYTSPQGQAQPARYQQRAELSGEIVLLGYDVSATRVRAGDLLEVAPYWMAARPLTETYQSFVHLVYPEDVIWSQSDHLNPAGYPTDLWPLDRYVRDGHRLRIPEEAPPGTYLLSVGLYTLADDRRLPVSTATCGQREDSIVLCQPIIVER